MARRLGASQDAVWVSRIFMVYMQYAYWLHVLPGGGLTENENILNIKLLGGFFLIQGHPGCPIVHKQLVLQYMNSIQNVMFH